MNRVEDQAEVRLATIDEASVISTVLREAFVEYEPLYTAAAFAATTPTAEQIRNRWDEGPVWVVLLAAQIVGTIGAVPSDQALYLRSMGIQPTARGSGLGWSLLERAENYAVQQAHKRMYLRTTPFLYRAIRLYEQFGFVRTAEGPHELYGTSIFTMEKFI
jgi:ribosomal protein S18 acetylase RimI-like enzyme